MDRAVDVYRRLLEHYGPQGWWPAKTSFEVVVGAILMPQTAWRNVEHAIANLREDGLLDLGRLAGSPIGTIRRHVRVAGLHASKPARLQGFCRHVRDMWGGDLDRFLDRDVDDVRRDLLRLPGIGPETADSILLYAGHHPTFVVDAYTVRIGRRIGLFRSRDLRRVKAAFEARVPRGLGTYREYHALLVEHAKARCRPRPRCSGCPLWWICDHGRKTYGPDVS